MPELPEVETVRRGLAPALEGQRIAHVDCRRPDLRFPLPDHFASRLEGKKVTALARRAKYLVATLSSGEALIMHLGMSGRFTITPKAGSRVRPGDFTHEHGAAPIHDHVVLKLGDGTTITYNDPRRFGFMLLADASNLEMHPLFRQLGPEPMGNALSAATLSQRAANRKADLKAFLMDQRTVAGLGNIYVCEALYDARLSPKRKASVLSRAKGEPNDKAERLVASIRRVLTAAIDAGGSTLRDYRTADGALGYFQHTFKVYGREGEPCLRPGCAGTIRRITQAGRSTFYCPACQK